MSLQPEPTKPSFHRGSFVDEIETARVDLAKRLLRGDSNDSSSEQGTPHLSPSGSNSPPTSDSDSVASPGEDDLVADSFAFAFDIDGVLIRGGRAIPEALEAMRVLNGENKYNMKM